MKKTIRIISVLSVLLLIMSFSILQLQSSLTKADYVEGSKTLKFTSKLSTDNISTALNTSATSANFDAEVKKYVGRNFVVTINGENKNLTFTGSQVKGDAVFVYFEISGVNNISSIKIKNSILLDAFPRQMNMINIAYKGSQKNMTMQRGKETAEVSF